MALLVVRPAVPSRNSSALEPPVSEQAIRDQSRTPQEEGVEQEQPYTIDQSDPEARPCIGLPQSQQKVVPTHDPQTVHEGIERDGSQEDHHAHEIDSKDHAATWQEWQGLRQRVPLFVANLHARVILIEPLGLVAHAHGPFVIFR